MPSQPPPPTTASQQPRSILKNNMTKSPVVNPNHLIGDASSRGALNANIAFAELRLLMIDEQPFDKKCNSDVQRKLTRSSRKKSSYECLSGELPHQGFESFISTLSTPSTGTFQDAKKRQVPTLAETKSTQPQQKNDSWGELDQSSKRNPRSSNHAFSLSANSYMLSAANISSVTNDAIGQVQVDLLPSTGSFMDASKRHVRTTSVSNQKWDRILLAGSSPNPLHLGNFKVPTKQSNHDQVVPDKERGDQLGLGD